MSNIVLEEYELMKDSKYRAYMSSVDKALRSFEYTSEWADLISALGKLNKVLLANTKFPVIPRRIKISKRLAQCMHPVLPSGVHLKALETYDIIFKCMGTSRLSYELFIYSSGLFPLLGHAAMIVRPSLLTVYETHFVPLGERLTPALSGFLSGVLPGLEEGSDHFDRTNSLLEKVCEGVGKATFYGCLWECLASNASIRLPGIGFALSHFNKKLSMEDQLHVVALCAAVQDTSVLVQRSTLDLLLAGLPMHNSQLVRPDMLQLVTAALTTILRRDMSLNRRLFAWLLGTEVGSGTSELRRTLSSEGHNYFDLYSRDLLVHAVKKILSQGQTQPSTPDLRPYKLLVSLLDKPDIGPIILDDILHEVFRTLYLSCEGTAKDGNRKNLSQSMYRGSQELLKTANLLFSALEPSYVWQFTGTLFENACKGAAEGNEMVESGCEQLGPVKPVDSGPPNIVEVCSLTQFLLDMVSLDTYADTPTEHLPGLFLRVLVALTKHCSHLSATELASSLQLCRRVLVRVQPGSWGGPAPHTEEDDRGSHVSLGSEVRESDDATQPEPIPQPNVITNEQSTVTESSLTSSITENIQNSLVSTESLKNKVTMTEDATAAPPVYLDSEGTLDLTDPVSIDSDSSSASLLMDSSHTPVEVTLPSQDSKSTKADTSLPEDWTQKASELQSLIDCTIPTGSLEAETCDTTSIISESTTLPFYDTSQTSMELSTQETKDWATLITEKAESIPIHSPVTPQIKINDENPSLKFATKERSDNDSVGDKSSRQHSVMSESLVQFQELFVRLVTKRILSAETDLATALHHLLSIPPKDSTEHRTKELENKLKECLGKLDTDKEANKGTPAMQQGALAMPGPEWPGLQECLNQACRLLVELSTFPTLCTPGRTPTTDREPLTFGEVPRRFPAWLQTLLVLCAGLNTSSSTGASSLQLLAAATFLDLLALLRAVPTSQHESLQQSRGVVTVLIIPLLTPAQVAFIEGYTAVFQTMARLLWDHLGAPCPSNHLQCAQLLLRLHNALPGSDVVEDVIGGSLNPDPQIERYQAGNQEDSQRVAEAFERFTTLWHLSREPGDLQVSQCRALDKSLFKMLDNLKRPPGPLQLQTQGWLLQALLRGDTARILEPLLLILLAPGTARVSVLHCTVSHTSTVLAKHSTPNEQGSEMGSSAARIFALSTQDGHVVYHVSEASCVPGRTGAQTCTPGVQARRIHAVTRLASGAAKQPAPHCITESAYLRATAELEENHKMSLIVNPMTDMEAESDSGQSFEEPSSHSSSSEWSKDATEPKVTEQRVVEGVLQEILDAVVQRDSTLEASSTSTAVHALHSHILLYAQVYDAQRTLYALGAVRSLLLTSPPLVTLLARHAQAAQGGRSFEGELGAEWTAAARSSMLLEALVSSLLWFTRSYYPNLGQARLTTAELAANRQVQLASAELLTLLLAELALLARDGGRGLAQYLADLLQRSRLPRLALGLLLASVHAARGLPRSSANSAQCFTEEILQFNHETETKRPASCPHRLPAHVEASQVQLLRLVLALVMLEEQASRQTRDAPESAATSGGGSSTPTSPVTPSGQQLRYLPGCPVPQQPIFLAAVMSALKLEHMSHLHQSWTVMLASALPFMGSALPHVVLKCCLPAQYAATQLEALATLLHYCLLDSAQQLIGQPLASTVSTIQASFPDAQPGQIFSNLMNFFVPAQQQGATNPRQDLQDKSLPQLTSQIDDETIELIEHDEASGMREKPGVNGGESLQEARRLVLSSLPRIMACATSLWQAVSQAEEGEGSVLGSPRAVRHQLVQFLSPIALHHGTHFLAAIAVVAASDSNPNKSPLESTEQQKVLVSLISSIRVLPFDTLVQTVQTVVLSAPQLAESWSALLALLRECVALPPPTPFLALALLSSLAG
ncbi:hypothetical protein B566_EDAN003546 [Ephemera danica]|nr:hypothetical protein B566_EDAN003546 [Ephemera danica]